MKKEIKVSNDLIATLLQNMSIEEVQKLLNITDNDIDAVKTNKPFVIITKDNYTSFRVNGQKLNVSNASNLSADTKKFCQEIIMRALANNMMNYKLEQILNEFLKATANNDEWFRLDFLRKNYPLVKAKGLEYSKVHINKNIK